MRIFRNDGEPKVSFVIFALLVVLGVLSLQEPGRAQSGNFCRWEPVGDNPTQGAYVCGGLPGASGRSVKVDPCFAQLNAMRPCTPSTPNRQSTDTYAAIAISPTNLETGLSWGAGSQAQAEQIAMQYCAKQGNNKDCTIIQWTRDACVAVAISHGTGHNDGKWGVDWNANRSVAQKHAISYCKNKDCKIQQSACSGDP